MLLLTLPLPQAVLNYGHEQSVEDQNQALGQLDLQGVSDGDVIDLPKHAFTGKRALSVEVFAAPHKDMCAPSPIPQP